MGRPSGEKRQAIFEALSERPMTARELAMDLRLSARDVQCTVDRLKAAEQVVVVRRESVAWSSRPVAVLAPAQSHWADPVLLGADRFTSELEERIAIKLT